MVLRRHEGYVAAPTVLELEPTDLVDTVCVCQTDLTGAGSISRPACREVDLVITVVSEADLVQWTQIVSLVRLSL